MKKFDIIDAAINAMYVFSSFMLSGIIASLALMILGKIFYIQFEIQAIISAAVAFCLCVAIFYCLARRSAYRSASFSTGIQVVELLIALAVNFLIGLIFAFPPITSGGVRNLAGIIRFGMGYDSAEMISAIPVWAKLVAFLAYSAVFILVYILAGKSGVKRREKERSELDHVKRRKEQEEKLGGFNL